MALEEEKLVKNSPFTIRAYVWIEWVYCFIRDPTGYIKLEAGNEGAGHMAWAQ